MSPGGQAGTSSRIENFPGFPNGISGKELAEAVYAQALRFGAEIIVGADMVSARREPDGTIEITLVNGSHVRARAAIGAPGVHYRTGPRRGFQREQGGGQGPPPNSSSAPPGPAGEQGLPVQQPVQ